MTNVAETTMVFSPELRAQQFRAEADFAAYRLPQLPDDAADTLYERLLETEQRLFSPSLTTSGYDEGSAEIPEELSITEGHGLALLTADHAVTHWRLPKGKAVRSRWRADFGTGALSTVAAEDTGSSLIAPLGRSYTDPNHDLEHPLKEAMRPALGRPGIARHYALHGMDFGRVCSPDDERGYNIIFGIGDSPSYETLEVVEKLGAIAAKYDFRWGVNQATLQFEADGCTLQETDYGNPKSIAFAARGAGTTRSFAAAYAQSLGKPLATVQIELGESLRLLPPDYRHYPGAGSQRIGAYLGYLFLKDCIELTV